MTRRRAREPFAFEIRYYAGARIGLENWSRKSYAMTLESSRQRAAMKLVVDWWQKVVILDRFTGRVIVRFVRTGYGIHEV